MFLECLIMIQSPQDVALRFATAIEQRDDELAQSCSTKGGWKDILSSPYSFFAQAKRKGFRCYLQAEQVAEARASVTVELRRQERRMRNCYFLLLYDGGHWLLAGIAATEQQAHMFLADKIPALLQVELLPSAASAEQFLHNLWVQLQAAIPVVQNNYSEAAREAIAFLSQQSLVPQVKMRIIRSCYLLTLQRAGIDFVLENGEEIEPCSIILGRADENAAWHIIQRTLLVDVSTLIADPAPFSLDDFV